MSDPTKTETPASLRALANNHERESTGCDWNAQHVAELRERAAEIAANAGLIAEAGTVYHETGLTPRQLAEENAKWPRTYDLVQEERDALAAHLADALAALREIDLCAATANDTTLDDNEPIRRDLFRRIKSTAYDAIERLAKGKPRLGDLRESGSVEQDADFVGLLSREEYYAERTPEQLAEEWTRANWRNENWIPVAKRSYLAGLLSAQETIERLTRERDAGWDQRNAFMQERDTLKAELEKTREWQEQVCKFTLCKPEEVVNKIAGLAVDAGAWKHDAKAAMEEIARLKGACQVGVDLAENLRAELTAAREESNRLHHEVASFADKLTAANARAEKAEASWEMSLTKERMRQ